jgi:hypothetical protein
VDVGVVGEIARPGVEHCQDAEVAPTHFGSSARCWRAAAASRKSRS